MTGHMHEDVEQQQARPYSGMQGRTATDTCLLVLAGGRVVLVRRVLKADGG